MVLREGSRLWAKGLRRHLEVQSLGRRAAESGMKRWRRGEVEDVLTSRSHKSVRGKRQGAKVKDTNPKGKHICENTPVAHGLSGLTEEAVAYGMGRLVLAVLKPNRIIRKHTYANCRSFHIRVFLGLSNP
jgi:hypothetical protein